MKKFTRYINIFLYLYSVILTGVIYFFINEIGIVEVTTEFGSEYSFFHKKKNMHRIFYIEPVGEQDLNQLSNERFNELIEFCEAVREDIQDYNISCGSHFLDELKRRNLLSRQ